MSLSSHPIILAIDTSCDDTSAAITQGKIVLSNIVASQINLHKPYGGVFPTIAKKAHTELLPPTIKTALQRAKKTWNEIDLIAVTSGPGLAPALEIGIDYAVDLAKKYQKPLMAINHVSGHLISCLAETQSKNQVEKVAEDMTDLIPPSLLPALAIVVSGGHSEFIDIDSNLKYSILGSTIDDAAGECLDKVGRMLNLGYPAGPVVEELGKNGNPKRFRFPLPMTESGDWNLSFSGLKTAARLMIEKLESSNQMDQKTIFDFCASIQTGVFAHIVYKLKKLLVAKQQSVLPYKSVWLGGGVAANQTLRQTIRKAIKPFKLELKTPNSKKLCGDNAAMIGIAAAVDLQRGVKPYPSNVLTATLPERKPRWSVDKML